MPHKDPEAKRAYHRAYYAKHGDRRSPTGKAAQKARGSAWHLKNKAQRNAKAKTNYRDNREKFRARTLKHTFGLSLEAYESMLIGQNGVCAICFQPEIATHGGQVRHLAVDHNHQTGQIRALLCLSCNSALGHLKEDPTRLHSMLRYIQQHNGSVDSTTS